MPSQDLQLAHSPNFQIKCHEGENWNKLFTNNRLAEAFQVVAEGKEKTATSSQLFCSISERVDT